MNAFAHPFYLALRPWLLAYGLLLLALTLQQAYAHRRALEQGLAARFGPAFSLPRALLRNALLLGAGWFLLVALATPLGEPVKIEGEAHGADVIVAVDVSSSMYAQDVAPNRLLALKSALGGFVSRLGGDRVGLVAFAGEAVIACPLTTDYDTASLFLDKLESDSVPSDGTGFGPAIKLCLDGFKADPKRGRMIILATDGEDTLDSDTSGQARRAGEMGIPIYCIGVGTREGAYIPGRPDFFGVVRAKTYKGQPVRVRVNPETLKKIASLSGGEYFEGASPAALTRAYEQLRRLKQGLAKSPDRFQREPLYQEPLLWAIALLLAEMLLSNRRGRSRAAFWRLTPLLLLLPGVLPAFSLDPARADYDEGNRLYRQGQYVQADELYERALARKPGLFQGHFNLGNSKFMREDYEGAIQAYEEALKLDPKDADTQYNLDLARKKMRQDQKQDPKDPKKDKQGKQDKKGQAKNGEQGSSGSQKQPGQGQGQNKGNQQGQSQGQGGKNLDQDQVRAMMNMLKNDQKRFGQAFQPLKKRPEQEQSPAEQMFEQMTGQKLRQSPDKGGSDRKDW